PIGKLFLWSEIDLLDISYTRLISAFVTSCLLFGAFSLWLVSVIKRLDEVQTLWFRIINPLFMFGAYFFPWSEAYNLNPYFAYPMLVNPLLYAMEAMRSAGLGPSGYLPFWICMLTMWGFIFFFTSDASRKLKKWLDCP
ncbi:MAG: ABC transporter permease, partial [Chlamydiia bacterium]|nr:ABC transporter permease [Chlamydiia bacterium]